MLRLVIEKMAHPALPQTKKWRPRPLLPSAGLPESYHFQIRMKLKNEPHSTRIVLAMNATLITAAAAILVAALSYLFAKWKEREADWRKWKYEHYNEFMLSLSGTVGNDSTPNNQQRYTAACNTLNLIGTKDVLSALRDFRQETGPSNHDKSPKKHDVLLAALVRAIRNDLGIKTPKASDFSVCLWESGQKSQKP